VSRSRKQINGKDAADFPAELMKVCEVACERRGVAGDIHYLPHARAVERIKQLGGTALARRVKHDHVGKLARNAEKLGRAKCRVGAQKVRVLNARACGVSHGALNRLGHYLNARKASYAPRHRKPHASDTAVKVKKMLVAAKPRHIGGGAAKKLGGIVIYLIKRRGRNVKLNPAENVPYRRLARNGNIFIAKYYVGIFRIYVKYHAHDARKRVHKRIRKLVGVGQALSRYDDANEYFAILSRARAQIEVAQKPLAAFLVINGNALFICEIANEFRYLTEYLRL
jgi:hypothetical protein